MQPNGLRNAVDFGNSARAAHVNMMTDTIIANMSPEGLRSIMRGLLGTNPTVTTNFHAMATKFLSETRQATVPPLFVNSSKAPKTTPALLETQGRYRCLMGCGYGFDSMESLTEVLLQTKGLTWDEDTDEGQQFLEILAAVDGDVVQAVTAVQKELCIPAGVREMSRTECQVFQRLKDALISCKMQADARGYEFAFARGLSRAEKVQRPRSRAESPRSTSSAAFSNGGSALETVHLGSATVPRIFMGLWQFSSPAWGTASAAKINRHFRKHVDAGFTAYGKSKLEAPKGAAMAGNYYIETDRGPDMADHYGDAEVIFGKFRSSQPDGNQMFCATKWCQFDPIQISKEAVEANITERLCNLNATNVELLQFHWQDYDNHQYIKAVQLIDQDPRVRSIGLVNFDTQRMNEVVESGVAIVSNQVQFSLIDVRPTFLMAESCLKHNIKLLTYGSLCGGFLADKWLNAPPPVMFHQDMTPSHRKYYEMIVVWGGWDLFQDLLQSLATVAKKYDVSISNAAVRWLLDHEYVAAVIVGARMGISEHTEENLKVFSFQLDADDKSLIQEVLDRSKAREVFDAMGDCGSEYR